ncbi:hypothetical protein [Tepidibacillus fermentans]|uniref:hypothetical protein n=1 Tax=Tepidibacillus fermentans TaxID=1281767 RepID=UPI00104AF61A|nr:hypothetical protein [Tepidibacillus fermentans]
MTDDNSSFLYLPPDLQEIWSNIPPEGELNAKWLEPIKDWIGRNANQGDLLLIQGEYVLFAR